MHLLGGELTTRAKDMAISMQRLSALVSGAGAEAGASDGPGPKQSARRRFGADTRRLRQPARRRSESARTQAVERKPTLRRPAARTAPPLGKVANMARTGHPLDDDELSSF